MINRPINGIKIKIFQIEFDTERDSIMCSKIIIYLTLQKKTWPFRVRINFQFPSPSIGLNQFDTNKGTSQTENFDEICNNLEYIINCREPKTLQTCMTTF